MLFISYLGIFSRFSFSFYVSLSFSRGFLGLFLLIFEFFKTENVVIFFLFLLLFPLVFLVCCS